MSTRKIDMYASNNLCCRFIKLPGEEQVTRERTGNIDLSISENNSK